MPRNIGGWDVTGMVLPSFSRTVRYKASVSLQVSAKQMASAVEIIVYIKVTILGGISGHWRLGGKVSREIFPFILNIFTEM